ncbi:conjugal transfer protein TraF [Vibrio sp. Y2-5]|uniref:conjugal transfer protein TraF n=1 Tax=Vibrio sp. Y2-5 TaxID=2743977 RepID=UPI0016606736|nr:conjugal transfer protein TraF [Vibrio sp. Y2-5]MBD0788198.1 conjugal transfer protein TraF [Vibrio sp. Y2-5]
MKSNHLAVVISLTIAGLSSNVLAGSNLADARSVGMGGTGVASADFITSSFHNVALGALYREEDDFGLLIPGVGAGYNDPDNVVDSVNSANDTYEKYRDVFENGADNSEGQSNQLSVLLDGLDNKAPVALNGSAGVVIAVPTSYFSVNVFADGWVDSVGVSDIDDGGAGYNASDAVDVKDRFNSSTITVAGLVTTEVGVSFSKMFELFDQSFAFGIAPKAQKFSSYAESSTIKDFDIANLDSNKLTQSAMNLDIGAAWSRDEWRVGLAVKDLIAKDIPTVANSITYELKPKATIGGAYVGEYFVASLDAELTKETRFTSIKDSTQYIRAGMEGNLFGMAQARLGYMHDWEGNAEDVITAGIGISPFDVVTLDVSATYASESSLGGAADLIFTF